jgi:hypothetical protein
MQHVIIRVPFPLIKFHPFAPSTFVATVTTHIPHLSAITAKPNSSATHIVYTVFRTHSDRISGRKSLCLNRAFAEFVETRKQVPQCRSASFQILPWLLAMTKNISGRIPSAKDDLSQGLILHGREQHSRYAGELKCVKVLWFLCWYEGVLITCHISWSI